MDFRNCEKNRERGHAERKKIIGGRGTFLPIWLAFRFNIDI